GTLCGGYRVPAGEGLLSQVSHPEGRGQGQSGATGAEMHAPAAGAPGGHHVKEQVMNEQSPPETLSLAPTRWHIYGATVQPGTGLPTGTPTAPPAAADQPFSRMRLLVDGEIRAWQDAPAPVPEGPGLTQWRAEHAERMDIWDRLMSAT